MAKRSLEEVMSSEVGPGVTGLGSDAPGRAAAPESKSAESLADEESGDDDADLADLPSDTEAALLLLFSEFPGVGGLSPFPVVLQHCIYDIVGDRSTVDQKVDLLQEQGRIRRFKAPTGTTEIFLAWASDYNETVDRWVETERKEGREDIAKAAANFIKSLRALGFPRLELNRRLSKFSQANIDALIRRLLRDGFLKHQLTTLRVESYVFSIPNAGKIVRNIKDGRKEVLSHVQRIKYQEILRDRLERKSLRTTCLYTRTVIRDLIGSSALTSLPTTSGALLRLHKTTNRKRRRRF